MDTITAFYNMFERFLPCAKSNLHVLRQKMRDFYNNVMKKKYRKKNVSVCWEMWGVSVCVVIVVINFFTTQFAYKKRNFFSLIFHFTVNSGRKKNFLTVGKFVNLSVLILFQNYKLNNFYSLQFNQKMNSMDLFLSTKIPKYFEKIFQI